MAVQAKSLSLTTQTEKAQHYTYLKEFRVDQCPLFLQHKCTQHKPFTCFYWHFMNQRRRRPIRKRDGTFNYSPDVYCAKYDETTGICPEGDDCPYLHRTAGDTERRYHLRYYKTGKCVYDTDSRGYCVKNGPHCAFAHGAQDMRNPVYDIHEIQAMDGSEEGANSNSGPNSLDKERNALNEDPRWQVPPPATRSLLYPLLDPNYVLANYKTELCKRPPRLCRQGYACPQYHNNRDRRRSPKKHKYRSTPCPNVKQGDEWGDPANCESGDNCPYCHTRTEQQFHPEIYKSTKCNDIQQNGYCPRGPFCAFAHVDKEISAMRDITVDSMTDLAAILSNALPSATTTATSTTTTTTNTSNSTNNRNYISQGNSSDSNNQPPTSGPGPIARPRSCSTSKNQSNDSFSSYLKAPGSEREDKEANSRKLDNEQQSLDLLDNSRSLFLSSLHQSNQTNQSLPLGVSPLAAPFYPAADTVESVVGNALDELSFEDLNVEASIEKDLENDSNPVTSSLTAGLRGSGILSNTAPVNIPGTREDRRLSQLSPPVNSPLGSLSSYQLSASLSSSVNPRGENSLDKGTSPFYSHSASFSGPKFGSLQSSGMFDFTSHQNMSPSRVTHPGSLMSSYNTMNSTSLLEMQRLRDEVAVTRAKLANWEETMAQARNACELWKREAEEANRREKLAEQQRDEALAKANSLQKELENMSGGPYLHALKRLSELDYLPFNQLKQLQQQLRNDLERLEKVMMYHQTAPKCMVCEEQNRSVTLLPCNHFVLCSCCAPHQKECPFCHREITQISGMGMSL